MNNKAPADLTYITSFVPRIKDIVNSKNTSILMDIKWIIEEKGIKSGEFGFANCIFSDGLVTAEDWGYIKYFQHADNYVTVLLFKENTPNMYYRRFIIDQAVWSTKWHKYTTTEVID